MNTETHRQLANDIWSICNLLRGPYKRNEYRKVILPLTVLRRFDCLLAPTKAQALITFPEPVGDALLTLERDQVEATALLSQAADWLQLGLAAQKAGAPAVFAPAQPERAALMEKVRSRIALRVETGDAPRFELIKIEAEMLNAQKTAQAAEIRLGQARAALRQTVGQGLPSQFKLADELRRMPQLPPLEEVRRALHQRSPDLRRVRAEMVRAERLLELERAQRWPTLAVKAGVDEDPELRTQRLGVVVSIPLWDRRRGPVDEAAAQLAKARHALAAEGFNLDQALEIAYQQYGIAEAQVTALESGIVKQAEAALKVAEAAYRFGERGFLEVLDAQRVLRAARSELINARYELAAAWIEIERLRAGVEGEKA